MTCQSINYSPVSLTFHTLQHVLEDLLELTAPPVRLLEVATPLARLEGDLEHVEDDLPVTLLEEEVAEAWRWVLHRESHLCREGGGGGGKYMDLLNPMPTDLI